MQAGLNAALIVLYDHNGRILLQHRSEDAERLPSYWAFFGGGVRDGETPLEAVKREAVEELKCELNNPMLFLEQDFKLSNAEGHIFVFIEPFCGDKSALELREGQGWGWFTMDEIVNLKMIGHDMEIARKIVTSIRKTTYITPPLRSSKP